MVVDCIWSASLPLMRNVRCTFASKGKSSSLAAAWKPASHPPPLSLPAAAMVLLYRLDKVVWSRRPVILYCRQVRCKAAESGCSTHPATTHGRLTLDNLYRLAIDWATPKARIASSDMRSNTYRRVVVVVLCMVLLNDNGRGGATILRSPPPTTKAWVLDIFQPKGTSNARRIHAAAGSPLLETSITIFPVSFY